MNGRVVALTLAQLVLSAGLVLAAEAADLSIPIAVTIGLVPLAIAFAIAEAGSTDLPIGDQVITISLSELVTAVALITSGPITMLLARVLGGVVVQLRRSTNPIRVAFNLSLFALDAAVAVLVFRLAVSVLGELTSPAAWFATIAAIYAGNLVTAFAVAAVVTATVGPRRGRDSVTSIGLVAPFMLATAAIGTVGAQLLLRDERALLLIALVGVLWWVVLRAVGLMGRRYGTLRAFHEHTAALQAATTVAEARSATATAIHALLGAELAEVWTVEDEAPHATTRNAVRGWGQVDVAAPLAAAPDVRADEQSSRGQRSAVAAVLHAEDGTVNGYLLAGWRRRQFWLGEQQRTLATIARQAEATLARLIVTATLHSEIADKHRRSLHDPLTELPNRSNFLQILEGALGQPESADRVGILLIELERFRSINETLGHTAGDVVVMAAGSRLLRLVRERDVVARLEGRRFAILARDTSEDVLEDLADRIHAALTRPYGHAGLTLEIGVTLGIASTLVEPTREGTMLLRRADTALNRARELGQHVDAHRPGDDEATMRRLRLAADLRPGIRRGEVRAEFQPKLAAATGAVLGVEALARWHHPDLGRVPPNQFIPLAEQTGVVADLTLAMLDQSLAFAAQWRARGHKLTVAINVPSDQLADVEFSQTVATQLDRHGVPPDGLVLEVTESATIEGEVAMATLDKLRELGVGLSIDDFGTGYSSLHYLHRIAASELKIDRSFVASLDTTASELIVRSTIDLAHSLGMTVVAEGVEDTATFDQLATLGCDVIQGWVAAPALAPAAFEEFMAGLHAGCWTAGESA